METAARALPKLKRYIKRCPVRLGILAVSLLLAGLYYALREIPGVANALTQGVARPWHRAMGRFSALFPFSLAELFYVLLILGALYYLVRQTVGILRGDKRGERFFKTLVTLLTAAAVFWTGSGYLWGVCYYGDGFEAKSGILAAPLDKTELAVTTLWFADLADSYAGRVKRDAQGQFAEEREWIFDYAVGLYDRAAEEFPFLDGPRLRVKPVFFSKFMSQMNFTGFFFPLTGEANLNVDAPAFLLPATVAHEMGHQRGLAPEQETNFAAILACLADGDPVFVYSGAALAYIYLGNALYEADYALWEETYSGLSEPFLTDLRANNDYWGRYETKAAEISESVYTRFLESNGQELGMESYGACVDLLVAYYYETAVAWMAERR